MALITLRFFSHILGKQTTAEVLLPDIKPNAKRPARFGVFYLLHGLSDDQTMWLRRTRLDSYAADYPLIIVMPDGGRSFYTDAEQGWDYGRFIGEELVGVVDGYLPTIADRRARAIGGLSMGGYGALRAALAYPRTFGSATSHSGALLYGSQEWNADNGPFHAEMARVFGPRPAGSRHDLVYLARKAARARQLPQLRIDCGTEDYLLELSRTFHARLTSLRIPHEYRESPGTHDWNYWDAQVREALAFHATAMGLKSR